MPSAVREERRGELETLASQGMSRRQIAAEMGWGLSKTSHWLVDLGIKTTAKTGIPKGRKPRVCLTCGETDPAKFAFNRRLLYSICKACRSKRYMARHAANRQAAVDMMGGKCTRCGYSRCLAALHFHHLDRSQKDPEWKNLRGRKLVQQVEELKKCILVCANCHAEIHEASGGRGRKPRRADAALAEGTDIDELSDVVELPETEFALSGRRRPGPAGLIAEEILEEARPCADEAHHSAPDPACPSCARNTALRDAATIALHPWPPR